jgi:hypothetical protein
MKCKAKPMIITDRIYDSLISRNNPFLVSVVQDWLKIGEQYARRQLENLGTTEDGIERILEAGKTTRKH